MRATLEQHAVSRQVGKVVYGAVIGLALIVALESHPSGPAVMAVWLLGTAVAVGLAELYSEVLGAETRMRQAVSRSQLRSMGGSAAAVGLGVASPAVSFLIYRQAHDRDTAFTVAKWSGPGVDRLLRLLGGPVQRCHLIPGTRQGVLVTPWERELIVLNSVVH